MFLKQIPDPGIKNEVEEHLMPSEREIGIVKQAPEEMTSDYDLLVVKVLPLLP